jgi:hypothetical protein
MPEFILHHCPLSPYSEKIRLALGLKGVSWKSVEIPVWAPRPKLTPMTGGYRRNADPADRGGVLLRHAPHRPRRGGAGLVGRTLSEGPGRPCQGARLVDREGLVLQCGVSHHRQHAGIAAGTDRRVRCSASTWIPQNDSCQHVPNPQPRDRGAPG